MKEPSTEAMLRAAAVLEGCEYSERYGYPELTGAGLQMDRSLDSILRDLRDIDGDWEPEDPDTMEEMRKDLLADYFEQPWAKPREAVVLAAEAVSP